MSLVERIKIKCIENKTNFKQLEQDLGLGNGSIRKWDDQKPSYDKVVAVAQKLNISLDWMILGKENNEFTPNEQKLLNLYRKADDRGKRNIMHQAESEIQELSLTTNQKLSTSKIG